MRWLYVLVASVVISTTLVVVATGASAAPKQQSPPKHFYGALDYSKAKHELYWGTEPARPLPIKQHTTIVVRPVRPTA